MSLFDEAKQKIKRMDLELWIDEHCQYKGRFHSIHWCLEFYRRKVVLAVLGDLQKTLKEELEKCPYKMPHKRGEYAHAVQEWKENFEKLLETKK